MMNRVAFLFGKFVLFLKKQAVGVVNLGFSQDFLFESFQIIEPDFIMVLSYDVLTWF